MSVRGRSDARALVFGGTRVQELLALALEHMQVPDGCAAVLEGSIAEGFGNVSSDVDFLLLDDSDETYPGTPTVLFADGRRVEVRLRSTSAIAADRSTLWRLGAGGERAAGRISDDLLNRCQRLARALVLHGEPLVAAVQATLPADELGRIASRAYAWRSRQRGRLAVALLTLGEHEAAAAWAEAALTYGAKAWAALRGETYVDAKWLAEQLWRVRERAAAADVLMVDRCRTLLPRAGTELSDPDYVAQTLALLPQLGVQGCGLEPKRVMFRRRPGVTTWSVDGRVHVMRDGHDVFVLSDAAACAWREVVFERPLPELLALTARRPANGPRADVSRLMAVFHRMGLVLLTWRGGGSIMASAAMTLPPGVVRPLLTIGGATPEKGGLGITVVPMPARRFAAAGMALVWANVMVENAREDAVGALADGQWGVLDVVVRRMLRWACLSLLNAYGVNPLPAHEEACAQLAVLPGIDHRLAADVHALDANLVIDGDRGAQEALDAVENVVARLRREIGAAGFPCSFADTDGWRATLETFYDWVRIGAHLDSAFPLDDLRAVLLSVDQRRATTAAAEAQD